MDSDAFAGTGPIAPAHAFDTDRVAAWLTAQVPGFRGPLAASQFKGGQSNPTFLLESPSGRYVLRRKPAGPTLRTAHAVDREFRITSVLHERGFPVARPLAFCDDATVMETPFFVMEHMDGMIFWNPALPGLDPSARRIVYEQLATVLADLHLVSIEASGLGDYGRPGNYFQRQVARWSEQYVASRTSDIPAMNELMAELSERSPAPSGRESVIHGDFRLDNVIFDRTTLAVRAVIDWELSTLGDPLADLSYACMVWHLPPGAFGSLAGMAPVPGIPAEAEFVACWSRRTGISPPADWARYLAFNMFRLAAILAGVGRRAIDGNASSRRAAEMGALVEPIATTACRLLEEGRPLTR
jgi:aminoglycoside phosphotransferase (APT) family kinase protein